MSKRKRRGRDQAPLTSPPSPPQPQTQLEQQTAPPASRTVATRSVASTTRFEGPIPPPAALADYDKVFPGCAERIVALAESQSAHRQELEKTVVRANVAAERRAQHSAFFLGVLVITIGGVLIYFDKDVQGLAAILGTLATLAGVFVYGRYQQAQERKRKAE